MHEPQSARDSHSFSKSKRLLRTSEFRTVFSQSRRISDQFFRVLIRFVENDSPPKLGLVVSRRVSRFAVKRNRIKRVAREVFRHRQVHLCGCELIVVARKFSAGATNEDLRTSLNDHFQQVAELCENH